MSETFADRFVTTTLTREWADTILDEDQSTMKYLDAGIEWFENNYNAVAEVKKIHGYAEFEGYELRAVAACDADTDVIQRGLNSIVARIDRGMIEVPDDE